MVVGTKRFGYITKLGYFEASLECEIFGNRNPNAAFPGE